MRKTLCEVYLSTPPVGYSGSLSTVNETNCNKKNSHQLKVSYELISNSCSTTMCLERDATCCIVLEKKALLFVRLTRGVEDFL